jgi:hypothetical protein
MDGCPASLLTKRALARLHLMVRRIGRKRLTSVDGFIDSQ